MRPSPDEPQHAAQLEHETPQDPACVAAPAPRKDLVETYYTLAGSAELVYQAQCIKCPRREDLPAGFTPLEVGHTLYRKGWRRVLQSWGGRLLCCPVCVARQEAESAAPELTQRIHT